MVVVVVEYSFDFRFFFSIVWFKVYFFVMFKNLSILV